MSAASNRVTHVLVFSGWLSLLGALLVLGAGCSSDGVGRDVPETHTTKGLNLSACDQGMPLLTKAPPTLAETGLYRDVASKTLDPRLIPYTPHYGLWSDGADKRRWIYLPPCTTIDSTDMNEWSFPVGTRAFKEFALDGVRIETRLVARTGPGPNDFLYATYLWNRAETEAHLVQSQGIENAKGTTHDVPSIDGCKRCHGSHAKFGGRPSRMLGFSAIQLSGKQLDSLVKKRHLSTPPQGPVEIPGDAVAKRALGSLHANCGSCHNASPDTVRQVDLDLSVAVGLKKVEDTGAYRTAVGQPNRLFNLKGLTLRVAPGDPAASSIDYRMGERGNAAQMPPVASEKVDVKGRAHVRAWIEALR